MTQDGERAKVTPDQVKKARQELQGRLDAIVRQKALGIEVSAQRPGRPAPGR